MSDEADTLTVWLDVALNMLGGFILMVLLLLALETSAKKAEKEGNESQGQVTIEIQWQDKIDADVDLWVLSPGDASPVGYSNKSGRTTNLLRDDLGKSQDLSDYNYEVAYTRGSQPGETIVNVHMYRGVGVTYPVSVKVTISSKVGQSKSAFPILTTTVQLTKPGEEITAIRFRLDSEGRLVPGSVNHVHKPLRNAQ